MNRAPLRAHRDFAITLIALFKFAKALPLFAIALGAVGLVRGGVPHTSERLLAVVSSGTERRLTQEVLSRITHMSRSMSSTVASRRHGSQRSP